MDGRLKAYQSKLAELSVQDGFVLWGGRVVIPKSLQGKILEELHREHLGVAKMKAWQGVMCGGLASPKILK